jgi:hypothetical protein
MGWRTLLCTHGETDIYMTAIAGIQQFGRSSEGGHALIWHLSTCRSLFIANIKRDRKCNMYSKNKAVLKFKDKDLCGYRV